jgi:hypothetical protein
MQQLVNHTLHAIAASRQPASAIALAFALAIAASGCGGSAGEDAPETGYMEPAATSPAGCMLAEHCVDIDVPFIATKACCSPVTSCGYEAPDVDPETLMFFPDVPDFLATLTEGDPNGRCVPETFYFDLKPGLWKHRVEPDEGEDILITPDCQSFTLAAFVLPGCCLPDNSCGLSTDESWPTLEVLAGGSDAPFTKPECVPANVLNQQLRDSGTLASLARTKAAGTCDHAALSAELPPRNP